MHARLTALAMSALMITLIGCDDGDGDSGDTGGGAASGEYSGDTAQACTTTADCEDGAVCVRLGDRTTCHLDCSVEGNECSGSAGCEGVGTVSVDICQPPAEAPSEENPPAPEEEPRLPCQTDAECQVLDPTAICAQWRGARDCTIPCTMDSQCNPPSVGGISVSLLECATDEGDESRTACLPNAACIDDPQDCFSVPGPDGMGGMPGFGGSPGFGDGF
ncbi:MAG: hypothetical protein ACE366_19300 [Bradymonadia bacterium]